MSQLLRPRTWELPLPTKAQNTPSLLAVPAQPGPLLCLRSDADSFSHPTPGSVPFQEKQVAAGTASQKAPGGRSLAT